MRAAAVLLLLAAAFPAEAAKRKPDASTQLFRDPARLVGLAQRLEAQGKDAEAMGFYDRALAIDPKNVPALKGAGANAMRRGDATGAFAYFAPWAAQYPRDWQAHLAMAQSLAGRGLSREALAVLMRAHELGAPAPVVAAQRGVALDLSGDSKAAQLSYAQALQAAPGDRNIAQRMALSFGLTGDLEAALQLLRRLGGDPMIEPELRVITARVYALVGRAGEAAQIAGVAGSDAQSRGAALFFQRLAGLPPREKAMAAHFGRLSAEAYAEAPVPAPAGPSLPPAPAVRTDIPVPTTVVTQTTTTTVATPPPTLLRSPPRRPTVEAIPGMRVVTMAQAAERERIWVQLASSPNLPDLAAHWRKVRRSLNGALDELTPHIQAAAATRRLLVGPFDSSGDAERFVDLLRSRRVEAVVARTPKGAAFQSL